MMKSNMLISLCIIAYNEEKSLKGLFDNILNQDYPRAKTQVVLVNNSSTDSTRGMMDDFAHNNTGYYNIVVVNCRKKLQAAAWNTAIAYARGDVIIRLDAHSTIPTNFLSENARCINEGEYVCGGARPTKAMNETPWQLTLLAAENSLFGSSFAKYRREKLQKSYVDSVFHAAYRREVFKVVGGFNEQLGRTEDNELHYRIRQAGYRICYDTRIRSYQFIRSGLLKMLKQKFSNGYWVALTLGVCPRCISLFHFIPFVFVCALILSLIVAIVGSLVPIIALLSIYLIFDIVITIGSFMSVRKYPQFLMLPLIFPLLHISYGIGSVFGFLRIPFWYRSAKKKSKRGIERVRYKLESS